MAPPRRTHSGSIGRRHLRFCFSGSPYLRLRAIEKCCLDREVYTDICDHPEAETLEETSRYVLRQLSASLNLRVGTADKLPAETPETEFPRWFRRCDQTMRRFAAVGIRIQTDVMASRRQYVKNRLEWERQLGALAAFAGYDWEEITGDRDLQAAEEPVDEPVGYSRPSVYALTFLSDCQNA